MSSYEPSRATPKTTIQSRYSPLNNNISQSDLASHPSHLMHNTNNELPSIYTNHSLHRKRITPPQPQPINNNNNDNTEPTKWTYGVGLLKSVWSNVVKPALTRNDTTDTNDTNDTNYTSQTETELETETETESEPESKSPIPLPLNNEFEPHNTVELLDNEALTLRVREIVQSDNKNDDNNPPQTPPPKKYRQKYNHININYFDQLLNGNLTPINSESNEPLDHTINQLNQSVVNDKKRQLSPINTQNINQPKPKRRKLNDFPIGVVRSHTNTNKNTNTNITRALQNGIHIIRTHKSPINTPTNTPILSQQSESESEPNQSKKRSRNVLNEIIINDTKQENNNDNEPPLKKIKTASNTPQRTPERTPDSPISRRHFRRDIIHDNGDGDPPVVSICCSVAALNENKQRYLKIYKHRFERIYGKYNMKNQNKINKWLKIYGGDNDKLHDLYSRICNKYDLNPRDKYDGQCENMFENECDETLKGFEPKMIPGIPINLNNNYDALSQSSVASVLTIANVDKHDKNDKVNVRSDDDSHSDTTHSTFQTPRKDIDQQSNKSDTVNVNINQTPKELNANGFFSGGMMQVQSKKKPNFIIKFNPNELQGDNDSWGCNDININNNTFSFEECKHVFGNNNNNNHNKVYSNEHHNNNNNNNCNNNNKLEKVDTPFKFSLQGFDNSVNTNNNQQNNSWNNTPNHNQWNINNTPNNNTPNNNTPNNSQWNNNTFGNNNPQNNTWNNNPSNNNTFNTPNNNWNNNNQFTFGNSNNNNSDNISRSGSVGSITSLDQSFFNQTPKKNKRKLYKARRRFNK